MTGKFHLTKWGIVCLVVVAALGSMGVTYACWNNTWWSHTWWNHTARCDDCEVKFTSYQSNDPGQTIDPGYDKHVASTEVTKKNGNNRWRYYKYNSKHLVVTVDNAYPSYQPTVYYWVKVESRRLSAKLVSIEINGTEVKVGEEVYLYDGDLLVTVNPPEEIKPRQCEKGDITLHVEQSAEQCYTYKFTVTMDYECTTRSNPGENSGGNPSYGKDGDQQYDKGKFNRWWWNR